MKQNKNGETKNCQTAAAAKSLQLCPTLCDPIDGGPPGSPVPGILQARTLEWVAISFSNAWKWKVKVKSLSCVLLFATPWTAAYQPSPSMGFSRQEYWSGVPLPSLCQTTWCWINKVSIISPDHPMSQILWCGVWKCILPQSVLWQPGNNGSVGCPLQYAGLWMWKKRSREVT